MHALTIEIWNLFTQQPKAPEIEQLDALISGYYGPKAATPFDEGAQCPFCNKHTLLLRPDGSCTCHLGHPPCSACENAGLSCYGCGIIIKSV